MSQALAAWQRAGEEAYFKQEQEAAARKLARALGRDPVRLAAAERAVAAAAAAVSPAGVLPQIAAHSLRLGGGGAAGVETRHVRITKPLAPPPRPAFAPTLGRSPLVLGAQLSLGRGKWESGSTHGASIFSVRDGAELASGGPALPKEPHEVGRAAIHASRDARTKQLNVRGMNLQVFPEYTPGRAMAWGGILAVWGTAAVVLSAARRLDIHSVDDVKSRLGEALAPSAATLATSFTPLKGGLEDTFAGFRGSRFAADLKTKLT